MLVYYYSASEEEEDQERDQNPGQSERRAKHNFTSRCGQGSLGKNLVLLCVKDLALLLFQSRTPALIFEHVDNTDFKVKHGLL